LVPLRWLAMALARVPPRFLLALSRGLVTLCWPLLARRRRIAAINIGLCFPERDEAARAALLRANLVETVMGVFEELRAWYAPDALLRGTLRIEGAEHLLAAQAAGQGVLLLTGHFIQAELASRLLQLGTGLRVSGVVRRHNSLCVEAELESARQRVFEPTLAKKDVRGLLRSLQSGARVVYSADQDFSYQHAFVPFFGVPAATLTGTARIVRQAGATMLPFWFHRADDGHYELRIGAPWAGWLEAEPAQSAAIYMRELEQVVREHPEQYLWVHRRFKTRPAGEPSLYR
jgi:KDO2-lipid IV(A) lauroyltransferase